MNKTDQLVKRLLEDDGAVERDLIRLKRLLPNWTITTQPLAQALEQERKTPGQEREFNSLTSFLYKVHKKESNCVAAMLLVGAPTHHYPGLIEAYALMFDDKSIFTRFLGLESFESILEFSTRLNRFYNIYISDIDE